MVVLSAPFRGGVSISTPSALAPTLRSAYIYLMTASHITLDTIPTSATEARIILLLEDEAAEQEYYGMMAESERHAENAWLRHAEYDPEAGWEADQNRYDRSIYGD